MFVFCFVNTDFIIQRTISNSPRRDHHKPPGLPLRPRGIQRRRVPRAASGPVDHQEPSHAELSGIRAAGRGPRGGQAKVLIERPGTLPEPGRHGKRNPYENPAAVDSFIK